MYNLVPDLQAEISGAVPPREPERQAKGQEASEVPQKVPRIRASDTLRRRKDAKENLH
jgi:hypothetical protein